MQLDEYENGYNDEYDDDDGEVVIEDEMPAELAGLDEDEKADLLSAGEGLDVPASSLAELYDQFEYEDLGQLDGGGIPAITEAVTVLQRPSSPRMARRTYGGDGSSKSRDGRVNLPEPIEAVRSIPCHSLVEDELRKLMRAWYFGAIYDDSEKPKLDKGESLWPLIRSIKGSEQKLRAYVPARFGEKRIAPSSWGLAITVNRAYNRENTGMRNHPAGDPLSLTSNGKPGYAFYDGHPMVQLAETLGWAWLGRPRYPNGTPNSYPDPAVFAWIRGWE